MSQINTLRVLAVIILGTLVLQGCHPKRYCMLDKEEWYCLTSTWDGKTIPYQGECLTYHKKERKND